MTGFDDEIQLMDVGAAVISEVPVYKTLLDRGLAHLHAFDGDDRHIRKIQEEYGERATIHSEFLFDGKEQTAYICQPNSGMTSLLRPSAAALRFFNGFEQFGRVEREQKVVTSRLDDVENLPSIDFLKMDVQGAELTILKNGPETLRECFGIQLEVSFVPLYEDQPSFGDIDCWMRDNGFLPHRFFDVKRWSIAPTIFNNDFRNPGNQLLEADIVYIRNPLLLNALSDRQLKVASILSHYCLKSTDLCIHALLELERRKLVTPDIHKHYIANLGRI